MRLLGRFVLAQIVGVALLLSNCGHGHHIQDVDSAKVAKERLNLRNSAFCFCMKHCDPASEPGLISDGSPSAYFQGSAYNLSAFEVVNKAAGDFIRKNDYKGKHGDNLCIAKCLEFYNSEELEELVHSLDDKLNMNIVRRRK